MSMCFRKYIELMGVVFNFYFVELMRKNINLKDFRVMIWFISVKVILN